MNLMEVAEAGFRRWAEKPHNRKWAKKLDGTPIQNDLVVNMAEAFRAALSQSQPAPQPVCATNGCGRPGSNYFERGGIGSHYCDDCHDHVLALVAPQPDVEPWPPGTAMKGSDPLSIAADDKGHRTRFSDSSFYDEVCVLCGATDARDDKRLDQPCPNAQPDAKASGVEGEWVLVPREPTDKMTFIGQSLRKEAVNSIGAIYREMLAAAPIPPTEAPGHTDLMVSPESIDAFLEKNPPTEAGVEGPEVERYTHEYFGGVYSGMTKHPKGEWVHLSDHNTIVEGLKRERDALDRLCDSRFDGIAALNGKLTTEREASARLREALERAQSAIASCLLAGGLVKDDDGKVQPWWDKIIEAQRDIAAALRELKGGE